MQHRCVAEEHRLQACMQHCCVAEEHRPGYGGIAIVLILCATPAEGISENQQGSCSVRLSHLAGSKSLKGRVWPPGGRQGNRAGRRCAQRPAAPSPQKAARCCYGAATEARAAHEMQPHQEMLLPHTQSQALALCHIRSQNRSGNWTALQFKNACKIQCTRTAKAEVLRQGILSGIKATLASFTPGKVLDWNLKS